WESPWHCASDMLNSEARSIHPGLHTIVLHELFPNESRPMVFRHQHHDPKIDSQHVGVIPPGQRIERIHKAIACPCTLSIVPAHVPQHTHTVTGQKRQRSTGRARNDTSIDGSLRWWSAPCCVPIQVVRGADSPEVFAVIRKPVMK